MPRLIPDGPDIPGELIQKQEAGEMVFFCGAGISVPTGLPGFRCLVRQVYESLGISPTSGEQRMIEGEKFPEALGVLEGRVIDGAMRSAVVGLLSTTPKEGSLRLHRALIRVSRSPSGTHLVTTNFDDRFARANDADDLAFHAGQSLPDLDNWNSVVHLHGHIRAPAVRAAVPPLVLTDANFGEAYLRNRKWAAEFVSELMDRYTVVFVGYSMSDVVLSYLTTAVTSQPVHNRIYALVGYRDAKQRNRRESKWSEKGIHPILYHSGNKHELLVSTVEEWAELTADPHQYRVQVALSGLRREPDKKVHEADPDRVVWALSDPVAIWPAVNRIRRTPVFGANAAKWLHEFAVGGLLAGTVQPEPHERGPAGPVITTRAEQQLLQTDRVANGVALWIEIHAHSPEVFGWVINHGHSIGFELRRRLWDRLFTPEPDLPDIPPRLRRLWTLLLAEPPEDDQFLLRLNRVLYRLSRENAEALDDILLRLLRPRLGVFPGPPPFRILSTDGSTPEEVALHTCGHTDVILGCRDDRPGFNALTRVQPKNFGPFLRRHAVTVTEYLKSAFVLVHRSDRGDAKFIHAQLADALATDNQGMAWWTAVAPNVIRPHIEGRRELRELVGTWTVLLDWVRECYRALPRDSKEREDLLRHWVGSNEKMLWRLALQAIGDDSAADFSPVGLILHRNAQEVLWDPNCYREVLPVLRQVGTRASAELQTELLDAVQGRAGSGVGQRDADGAILAKVGPRLAALHQGGVTLSPAAAQTLGTFERRRTAAHRPESSARPVKLSGPIRKVAAALQSGLADVAVFREFAQRRPVAAVLALQEVGHTGKWPVEHWKAALDVVQTRLRQSDSGLRRIARLTEILLETPDDLFRALSHENAWLLDVIAKRWSGPDDSGFWNLWMRGWEHRSQKSALLGPIDVLSQAINTTAGMYASAAMKRIQRVTSEASAPITSEQESILNRILGDESGSAGIVVLVFNVDWLYKNAAHWTTRHILPRMRWGSATSSNGRDEEVCALWAVVAVRGWVSRDLVRVLGADFWTAVQRHKELDRGERLIRFFIYVTVSDRTGLIDESTCQQTAHIVIRDKPRPVGLALRQVLDERNEPNEQVWRDCVHPWLRRFWPREKSLNTDQSSSALVDVIMGTGDAFPEAVDWADGYLTALDDRQILEVVHHESIWKTHPRATVALLHRIVPTVGIEPWASASLVKMLETLSEVEATIPQDPKFKALQQRAVR